MTFFTEIEQLILKFINNHKKPQITKAILRRKNKAESITSPISTVLQSYSDQNSNSKKTKQNTVTAHFMSGKTPDTQINCYTASPDINPCTYNLLIYDKGGKITMKKKTVFSTIGAGKTGGLQVKQMRLEHSLTANTQTNSKWIKGLNI